MAPCFFYNWSREGWGFRVWGFRAGAVLADLPPFPYPGGGVREGEEEGGRGVGEVRQDSASPKPPTPKPPNFYGSEPLSGSLEGVISEFRFATKWLYNWFAGLIFGATGTAG